MLHSVTQFCVNVKADSYIGGGFSTRWLKWRVNSSQSITTAANDIAVAASSSTGAPLQQRQMALLSPLLPPVQHYKHGRWSCRLLLLHRCNRHQQQYQRCSSRFCRAIYERHCRPSPAGVVTGGVRESGGGVGRKFVQIYTTDSREDSSRPKSRLLSHMSNENEQQLSALLL